MLINLHLELYIFFPNFSNTLYTEKYYLTIIAST